MKKRLISASGTGYAVPYWRSSIASRITMPAAELELGDIIQSTYSHRVALSPTWIARRVSPLVSTLNMRTVWWSYCEKPSAVTIAVLRTRCRAPMSLG